MKKPFKKIAIAILAVYLVNQNISGLVFGEGIKTLFLLGLSVAIFSMFVRPILNILTLPFNLMTFGIFRFATSALAIYLSTLFVPAFSVKYYSFAGFSTPYFDIPKIYLVGFLAYLAFSLTISIFLTILDIILK